MQYIKKIADVIIGFSGSSEDPEKMSLRFISIIMGVIGKIFALCAVAGYTLPFTLTGVQYYVGIFAVVIASLTWLVGLIRALFASFKTKTV